MVGVVEGFRWAVLDTGNAPWALIGVSAGSAAVLSSSAASPTSTGSSAASPTSSEASERHRDPDRGLGKSYKLGFRRRGYGTLRESIVSAADGR